MVLVAETGHGPWLYGGILFMAYTEPAEVESFLSFAAFAMCIFPHMQAFVPITNAPVTLNTGDELKFRCKFDTTKENSEVSVCPATLRFFNFFYDGIGISLPKRLALSGFKASGKKLTKYRTTFGTK
jgi:hypothetical protein